MKKALAWHVADDGIPTPLKPGFIDLEKHLEDWIDRDPDIVADDVLLIGRQLKTHWGTILDLLGIDEEGRLVVLELKRHQTLRETVAQSLEYVAWASTLSYEDIISQGAKTFLSESAFRDKFEERFGVPLPDTLNTAQRVLVVAPNIDDATSFVIEHLSATYGVPINAVSFDVFGQPGDTTIVRHFVLEQDETPAETHPGKDAPRKIEDSLSWAEKCGQGQAAQLLLGLRSCFTEWQPYPNKYGWTQYHPTAAVPTGVSGLRIVIKPAGTAVQLRANNLAACFGSSEEECEQFIAEISGATQQPYGHGFTLATFKDLSAVEVFVARFKQAFPQSLGAPK